MIVQKSNQIFLGSVWHQHISILSSYTNIKALLLFLFFCYFFKWNHTCVHIFHWLIKFIKIHWHKEVINQDLIQKTATMHSCCISPGALCASFTCIYFGSIHLCLYFQTTTDLSSSRVSCQFCSNKSTHMWVWECVFRTPTTDNSSCLCV